MKRTLLILLSSGLLAVPTLASAQVKIGDVTLTKPSTPAPRQNTTRPTTSVSSAANSSTNVPAGWFEVKGRISAAGPVTLPAGSSVNVMMEDQTSRGQFVRIQFKTSRLSTPYQIIFSPGRLNGSHKYTVRATITDANGKLLYQSSSYNVPNAARNVIDLPVR